MYQTFAYPLLIAVIYGLLNSKCKNRPIMKILDTNKYLIIVFISFPFELRCLPEVDDMWPSRFFLGLFFCRVAQGIESRGTLTAAAVAAIADHMRGYTIFFSCCHD